jgi:mono/diheme cytochrome c family protein
MARAVLIGSVVAVAVAVRLILQPPEPRAVRATAIASADSGPALRGREVYARYGCAQCHGADATGGFPNPNAETDSKVPGLVFVKEGYTQPELRKKILDGAPTIGRGDPKGPTPPYRMPGWAGQMSDAEASDLVEFLLSLYPKSAEEKWR